MSELFWRLKTRSWVSRVSESGAKTPPRFMFSMTTRTALELEHWIPGHLQKAGAVLWEKWSFFAESAFDLKWSKADASGGSVALLENARVEKGRRIEMKRSTLTLLRECECGFVFVFIFFKSNGEMVEKWRKMINNCGRKGPYE